MKAKQPLSTTTTTTNTKLVLLFPFFYLLGIFGPIGHCMPWPRFKT